MRSILVLGSIPEDKNVTDFKELCFEVGKRIIETGHKVINGGSNRVLHVDKHVAEGALRACEEKEYNVEDCILAMVREGVEPNDIGISIEVGGDVEIEKRMNLVEEADAIIAIGGGKSTGDYLFLGGIEKKPIIPLPMFKGTSQKYWKNYTKELPKYFPKFITPTDFRLLHRVAPSNISVASIIAESAVNLAMRFFTKSDTESNLIFIAMPFGEEYNNTFTAIELAVVEANKELVDIKLDCKRIDQEKKPIKIDNEIENRIKEAKIVIADVSEINPNVYYEFGFARGQGTIVIPVAIKGKEKELPLDTRNFSTILYNKDNIKKFAETLKACLNNSYYI